MQGVGDRLETLIESNLAVRLLSSKSGGCGCKTYAARMNKWGVAGCRQRRKQIVEHLLQQFKKQAKLPLIASMFANSAERIAAAWVHQAIEQTAIETPAIVWQPDCEPSLLWHSQQSVRAYVIGAGEFFVSGVDMPRELDQVCQEDRILARFVWMPPLTIARPTTVDWLGIPRCDADGRLAEDLPCLFTKDAQPLGDVEQTAEYARRYSGVFV